MSTTTSVSEVVSASSSPLAGRAATMLEVLLVYAGILLYIWRWQFTHPRAWMPLLAVILASHIAHRDSLHALGLTWRQLHASARLILPLAVAIYIPLLLYGLARRGLILRQPTKQALWMFLSYGTWCWFQQYLAQAYFHTRLMALVENPHWRASVVALMFGAAHIPNPILMVVTTVGGWVLAEVYARHRNIWPLALAQAVGGMLVAAVTPASLIHNMRVGPGYFFFGVR